MVLIDVYECIGADGDGLDFCHSWHYFEISIVSSVVDVLSLSLSLILRHKSTSIRVRLTCPMRMYANATKIRLNSLLFSAISSFIMEMEFDSMSEIFSHYFSRNDQDMV